MRSLFFYISLVFTLLATGQRVTSTVQDFGKVKEWNNPIFEVVYTNTSGRTQLFLPIGYKQDVGVRFEKEKLAPGESTIIQMQYYTEEFGRFSKDIDVFLSTQNAPITFTLKGNIQSFHPDAFSMCPSIDNIGLVSGPGFNHTIRVIDADTKLPLTDFEIIIATKSSKEIIRADKSAVILKREKPDFYTVQVDKEEYEIQAIEKYINRNTNETVIALVREPRLEEEVIAAVPAAPQEVVEVPAEIKETEKTEETYADEQHIEKEEEYFDWDNPNSEEELEENKETTKEPVLVRSEPLVVDTADFAPDGKLSDTKYAYNHIIFLIDISTSMRNPEKLPLLKESMKQMIAVLRPQDKVSIITYSTEAIVAVSNVSGADKTTLNNAIEELQARGQSYGQEGVDVAYELAKTHFIEAGNNEVILASDGVFNSKKFSENKLYRQALIQHKLSGVRISTIAFGNSTKALLFLETLAQKGNGSFIRMEEGKEQEAVLISNLMRHSTK